VKFSVNIINGDAVLIDFAVHAPCAESIAYPDKKKYSRARYQVYAAMTLWSAPSELLRGLG